MSNAHILAAQKLFQGMTGKAPVHLKAGRCAARRGMLACGHQARLCFRSPYAGPGRINRRTLLSSFGLAPHTL